MVNCNGAGDAFTSGFVVAAMLRKNNDKLSESLNIEAAVRFASLVALRHVCSSTSDDEYLNVDDLLDLACSTLHETV